MKSYVETQHVQPLREMLTWLNQGRETQSPAPWRTPPHLLRGAQGSPCIPRAPRLPRKHSASSVWGSVLPKRHQGEWWAAIPGPAPSASAYQPSQHTGPPWCPATRCRTRWETAPPGDGRTPDTLSNRGDPTHHAVVFKHTQVFKEQRNTTE